MPRGRYKLIRLQVESLGTCDHSPACEDVQLVVLLEAQDGSMIERRQSLLAYHEIMRDPEQFPPLIAESVRAMMVEANRLNNGLKRV